MRIDIDSSIFEIRIDHLSELETLRELEHKRKLVYLTITFVVNRHNVSPATYHVLQEKRRHSHENVPRNRRRFLQLLIKPIPEEDFTNRATHGDQSNHFR